MTLHKNLSCPRCGSEDFDFQALLCLGCGYDDLNDRPERFRKQPQNDADDRIFRLQHERDEARKRIRIHAAWKCKGCIEWLAANPEKK